jgi:UDP-N-acetylglucosamine 2-epimerase (non-hydrolysing)
MGFTTLCIIGTRPEAIKMAPVIQALKAIPSIQNKVCVTGQHRQMLDSVLHQFNIKPDYDLAVMTPGQNLSQLTAQMLTQLQTVNQFEAPQLILVQGDTTTALVGALSAFYHHIPVAHVEAGLRTGSLNSPWPEEGNRKLISVLAQHHFAPTEHAKQNLLREGVPLDEIHVTGNTVIDALQETVNQLERQPELAHQLQQAFPFISSKRRLIFVTGHRRESFGDGFQRICQAIVQIACLHPDVDIVYPVHLNPQVQAPVKELLGGINNIYLIDPVDYLPCIYLMKSAYLILTDSGGIQEEAPSLGKPVIVMRDTTERTEAIEAGTAVLAGTLVNDIVHHVQILLTNPVCYQQMSTAQNPYGDGTAAQQIVQRIIQHYGLDDSPNHLVAEALRGMANINMAGAAE